MGYLLSGNVSSQADEMGMELSGYMGDGMDGYVGDGLEGYVGAQHQAGAHHQKHPGVHYTQMLQPLPIPETTLTAAQTVDISSFPQRGFKPHRLVVPSTLGPLFKINDIKVGQETQYVASGTIYGECFSEVAVSVVLKGTPARLGNNIILNVTNRDVNNSQTFSAMLMGYTETT
jgi:hypothetical protein